MRRAAIAAAHRMTTREWFAVFRHPQSIDHGPGLGVALMSALGRKRKYSAPVRDGRKSDVRSVSDIFLS